MPCKRGRCKLCHKSQLLTHIQGCLGIRRIENLFKVRRTEEMAPVGNLVCAGMLTVIKISVKSIIKGYQH